MKETSEIELLSRETIAHIVSRRRRASSLRMRHGKARRTAHLDLADRAESAAWANGFGAKNMTRQCSSSDESSPDHARGDVRRAAADESSPSTTLGSCERRFLMVNWGS
jgi:uncharacterized protein YggE